MCSAPSPQEFSKMNDDSVSTTSSKMTSATEASSSSSDDSSSSICCPLTVKLLEMEDRVNNLDKLCSQTQGFIAARLLETNSNPLGVVLTMKQYHKLHTKRTHAMRTAQAVKLIRDKVQDGELLDYQTELDCILNMSFPQCKMGSNKELLQEAYTLCGQRPQHDALKTIVDQNNKGLKEEKKLKKKKKSSRYLLGAKQSSWARGY